MKFSIKDFFIKCDQVRRKLRIWSHLQKKSFMENFIFCALSSVISPKTSFFCAVKPGKYFPHKQKQYLFIYATLQRASRH